MPNKENFFTKIGITDIIKTNATLFTGFVVALIFFVGVTLKDNPERWWISAAIILGFFVITFVFINLRVVIKFVISIITMILLASTAFSIGAIFDPYGTVGMTWMLSTIFIYSFALTLSYSLPSGRSRWTGITLTLFASFIINYALIMLIPIPIIAIILGIILSITLFLGFYLKSKGSRYSYKKMPQNHISEKFVNDLKNEAEALKWSVYHYKRNKKNEYIIMWGENQKEENIVFTLYPIILEQKFGLTVKRKQSYLSYMGNNIKPWLINIVFKTVPYIKVGNIPNITLLSDLNNSNGTETKTIALTLPDTKNEIPVGIIPSRISKNGNSKIISTAITHFSKYSTELNKKQLKNLNDLLIK